MRGLSVSEKSLVNCGRCSLNVAICSTPFNNGPVGGDGRFKKRILIVGRDPGSEEDKQGRPFVGKCGKLLDSWLLKLGLDREDVFIINAVRCHTRNNIGPTEEEYKSCRPLLRNLIEKLAPKLCIPLGIGAMKYFFGDGVSKASDYTEQVFKKDMYSVAPFYHPSYILRQGGHTDSVDRWLELLKRTLKELRIERAR